MIYRCIRRDENQKILLISESLLSFLLTGNGFGIYSGTERAENPGGKYDKQGCGLKAFVRLSVSAVSLFAGYIYFRSESLILLDIIKGLVYI